MAVTEIRTYELYADAACSEPKEQGLMDPKLGTIDRNIRCTTCHNEPNKYAECTGHFGYVNLVSTAVFCVFA